MTINVLTFIPLLLAVPARQRTVKAHHMLQPNVPEAAAWPLRKLGKELKVCQLDKSMVTFICVCGFFYTFPKQLKEPPESD